MPDATRPPLDVRVLVEPQQGASYAQVLNVAQAAEELGFAGLFSADHYQRIPEVCEGDGMPGPLDAWTTLAGLARDTTRLRLGTLMSPVTFRHPSALAIQVAQVDAMSDGRVEVGLGTGWYEAEHRARGIPFGSQADRNAQQEEQIAILTGIWRAESTYTFHGRHYRLQDCPALPKPVQRPHPPLILGGKGARRSPRIAARYADEYNLSSLTPTECSARYETMARECVAAGREPAHVVRSCTLTACIGHSLSEAEKRADTLGRSMAQLTLRGLTGSLRQATDRLAAYTAAGVQRVYVKVLDLDDLDHLELLAELARTQGSHEALGSSISPIQE
ncbi:LLM class F420-dependent oxidoreductase [Streptomyces sp. NPDC050085]|uniref:LLM class F420-dependent oxidoreductase n=1 Tax=Streptomyces sp. NPDC050085 TaxID=3365600 RepID=UPI00379ACFC6